VEEKPNSVEATDLTCDVCGASDGNRTIESREMMFGSRERFTYVECAGCGCLRLLNVPADMSRYYDRAYYSIRPESPVRAWVRRHRLAFRLGYLLQTRRPLGLPEWWPPARRERDASILDVGCGRGNLLLRLWSVGFTRLTGIDPFIARDVSYGSGLSIRRQSLADTDGLFDVIVLNHSFEHMPEPKAVMLDIKRLLAPGGVVVIRTPVASSWAHREYQGDWVQLDAPRHLYVHTKESIERAAGDAGLSLDSVVFDSEALQLWASEQYRRDIPLLDQRSYGRSPRGSIFTRSEVDAFERRAQELNRRGEGDQACFYLSAVKP
jgi:SAM-dependent methyltransferase